MNQDIIKPSKIESIHSTQDIEKGPTKDQLNDDKTEKANFTNQNDNVKSWKKRILGDIYAKDDPKQLSMVQKYVYVFLAALLGINATITILIYMPGIYEMMQELNTSISGIDASMAIYLAFTGISPLFWSSLSDVYGRKPMYFYSLIISIIASIICAFSKNITMLIIFRALQSFGSSAGQVLGAGIVSDLFDVTQRGSAYGWFYIGPLFSTVIGPTLGGFLCQFLGWRSTFYFATIYSTCLLVIVVFLLPETLRMKRDENDDGLKNMDSLKQKEKFKALQNMRKIFLPMFSMILDPAVALITFYNTIVYAGLYVLSPSITDVFQTTYHFNSWMVGLCYLCLGVGFVCSSIFSGMYSDFIMKKLHRKLGPENVEPEMRLKATIPSFFLLPAGFLIYGWAAHFQVGPYAPLIGIFIYGLGQLNSSNPASVYLVDYKPKKSASTMAINNCVRSVTAAIMSIFSTEWARSVGPHILYSIMAAISISSCIPVILVYRYGKQWRLNHEKRHQTAASKDDNL